MSACLFYVVVSDGKELQQKRKPYIKDFIKKITKELKSKQNERKRKKQ